MKKRILGKQNALTVSAIGLGCMGFSHGYGPSPDHGESVRLIRTAYELGCTFLTPQKAMPPVKTKRWSERRFNRFDSM